MDRYSLPGETPDRTASKKVGKQALVYIGAFYIAWIPNAIAILIKNHDKKRSPILILFVAICTPLQGFLNLIVYIRPKIIRHFEMQGNQTMAQSTSS